MVRTNHAQRVALFKLFQRDFPTWVTPTKRHERPMCPKCGYGGATVKVPSEQYRNFRRQLTCLIGGDGCVLVPWHGMWIGIEPDGYVHS